MTVEQKPTETKRATEEDFKKAVRVWDEFNRKNNKRSLRRIIADALMDERETRKEKGE